MESAKSFGRYSRTDTEEEQAYRRKTRKRIIVLIASSFLLLAIIAGAVAAVVVRSRNDNDPTVPTGNSPAASSISAVCKITPFPDSCMASVSALQSGGKNAQPQQIFKLSLQAALKELRNLSHVPDQLASRSGDPRVKAALADCTSVLEDAVDYLNETLGIGDELFSGSRIDEVKTWISSAITDHETCLDGLREINSTLVDRVTTAMNRSSELTSNSLAIVVNILGALKDFKITGRRRILTSDTGSEFPSWVGSGERRLLQVRPKPDVIVAKDGSGQYTTISAAVKAVPKKSPTRFVIYVKEGRYVEQVLMDKSKWNVMIYGDGMSRTIVVDNKNFVDGTPTYSTATFAVMGKGFIAKDIGFMNSAGPTKHQAVAFRSGADQSVMYRCSFDAFQDTLYAHSNRQFYRDCRITGTVDFIFGNAAAVFQNCTIQPRQPLANQFNTITAQGKKDVNQNTGFSIQKCYLMPIDTVTAPTYLGRPWKQFSTTVVMQSYIGSFLNSLGWVEWVRGQVPPASIFYAEYQNSGPGSPVDGRVKWSGYHATITQKQAARFAVSSLIQGPEWLPQTEIAFEDLI